MQNLIIRITQENTTPAENPQIGCYILSADLSAEFVEKFSNLAHQNGKIILSEGSHAISYCQQKQTDGIILDTSKEVNPKIAIKNAQAKLPKNSVLGVICRNRRHEAMIVSECEPDFIIFRVWNNGFAENAELIEWYNELFLIQSAIKPEEKCDYKQLPSDFVILDDVTDTIFVAK